VAKAKTEQEEFWSGEFGDQYCARNCGEKFIANQINYFSRIIEKTGSVKSVIEFGANVGENLKAIRALLPEADLAALEINRKAVNELRRWAKKSVKIYHQSIFDFKIDKKRDFVFTKGVLIHLNPEKLPLAYEILYKSSKRYICIGEYYNPSLVQVNYRGNTDRLFKRDFAGELMKKYKDLKLVDYGFCYHLDPNFPQDDITWFLLEK